MARLKTFVAPKDSVSGMFRKEKKVKKQVEAQTSTQGPDNLNSHVSEIKEIISEHGKRIKEDREVLELWLQVFQQGNTSGFVDNPAKWTDKEWSSYVGRQKRATNEVILLTRKS